MLIVSKWCMVGMVGSLKVSSCLTLKYGTGTSIDASYIIKFASPCLGVCLPTISVSSGSPFVEHKFSLAQLASSIILSTSHASSHVSAGAGLSPQ